MSYSDMQVNSKYFDLESIKMSQLDNNVFEYKGRNLNIHFLTSKYEQLRWLDDDLAELRIHLDFFII